MILASKRLNIQHYTDEDLDDFNAILMSDTIMKSIRGKGYSAKVSKEKFEAALLVNAEYSDLGFFNVTNKETNELVGFAKLVLMKDGNLEIGYAILEKLWGYGFASEITVTLVAHALQKHPTKEIIGIVNIQNDTSAHVLKKQGFKIQSIDFLDNLEVAYYHFSK